MAEAWIPLWERSPPEGVKIVVKVQHPNGEYGEDIGLKPFEGNWQVQFFKTSTVVAWAPLPP